MNHECFISRHKVFTFLEMGWVCILHLNVHDPKRKFFVLSLSSESRDKFMKVDERIVNMETPSNDSESRTTDTSSTKKRDPSERVTLMFHVINFCSQIQNHTFHIVIHKRGGPPSTFDGRGETSSPVNGIL